MNDTVFIWNDTICTEPFVTFETGKIQIQLRKNEFLRITNKKTVRSFELGRKSFKSLTIHRPSFCLPGSLFFTWDESISAEAADALYGLKLTTVTGRNGGITGIHLKYKGSKKSTVNLITEILTYNGCTVI